MNNNKAAASHARDVLVELAEQLPQLEAECREAYAAQIRVQEKFWARSPASAGPTARAGVLGGASEEHAAAKYLERCQAKAAAGDFARQCLSLRAAIRDAIPAIEARIHACERALSAEREQSRDAAAAASAARARRDALQSQREAVGSRQAEIDAAQARLAAASDSGDDDAAETAAREISRIRREELDTSEPLELRLQAACEAAERAETQNVGADARVAVVEKALREALIDRLKLARDEAAADLRDRDIELATAGYFERSSTEYSIGMTPEVLQHLGGQRQKVTGTFIDTRAKQRRLALESGVER